MSEWRWQERAVVALPGWVRPVVEAWPVPDSDAQAMAQVAALARENVEQGTGGPFAAAIYACDADTGRSLLAVGVNLVTLAGNSCAHAEIVAIMLAQQALGAAPLAREGARFELFTSCEPCAMCLGAVLWSGARRLVCGATRSDAESIGFDEGPVFSQSYRYLEDRGVEVVREVERSACAAALYLYRERLGRIYNG